MQFLINAQDNGLQIVICCHVYLHLIYLRLVYEQYEHVVEPTASDLLS